jgi:hypothetical protein
MNIAFMWEEQCSLVVDLWSLFSSIFLSKQHRCNHGLTPSAVDCGFESQSYKDYQIGIWCSISTKEKNERPLGSE